ncbi:D-aspartate oxidase-like isoform X2 [Topomyia yanbarensis]|uniref:D-aspartate oxidase-like isoform X2 n=1 Tax=Topomyia yanbarensis TaxID=2498891 RepID=UPI00273C001D|nr:D-aspartate oxidase-like isoform X2 [Topomyia yanbarensis]
MSGNGSKLKFIVLGAGINGLSCAFRISTHYPDSDIEIISEQFSPFTTSDVAAGLWEPYLLGETPRHLVRKWSNETYKYFHEMWKTGHAAEAGISLVPYLGLVSNGDDLEDSFWKDYVFGFRVLTQPELRRLGTENDVEYTSGTQFVTFTCEPTKLLQFYTNALRSRGAVFRQKKVDCFQALDEKLDRLIVINCLGLASGKIISDEMLKPCRGQVRRVHAPWVFHVFTSNAGYVIPNTSSVTLGGTKQEDDCDLTIRAEDSSKITKGCYGLIRILERAPVIADMVGLRPTRNSVRLEVEFLQTEHNEQFPIIHNYGHGGSGITLAWGCAGEVLNLVHHVLNSTNYGSKELFSSKSKL